MMMKRIIASILLVGLLVNPGLVAKVKEPKFIKDIKRHWQCLTKPTKFQCSKQERDKARKVFAGAAIGILVAALAAVGIAVGAKTIKDAKKKAQEEHLQSLLEIYRVHAQAGNLKNLPENIRQEIKTNPELAKGVEAVDDELKLISWQKKRMQEEKERFQEEIKFEKIERERKKQKEMEKQQKEQQKEMEKQKQILEEKREKERLEKEQKQQEIAKKREAQKALELPGNKQKIAALMKQLEKLSNQIPDPFFWQIINIKTVADLKNRLYKLETTFNTLIKKINEKLRKLKELKQETPPWLVESFNKQKEELEGHKVLLVDELENTIKDTEEELKEKDKLKPSEVQKLETTIREITEVQKAIRPLKIEPLLL